MAQPSYPLSKEEYIQKKQQEQQEALKKLEQGVKEVFTSEKYEEFLKTYSKFHKYSINNSIMILMQRPDTSNVASFQTWKKIGRQITKGEKGIKVLVPIPYKYEKEVETNQLDGSGNHVKETKELKGTSFRVGNVFDISQTVGKELPKLTVELKEYSAEIEKAIDAIARTSDVPVRFESDMPRDKKGYYHIKNKEIVINDNLSDTQTFKTLIHEIAHSKIHAKDLDKYNANEREVQAESVAYVVCSAYGIDTSEYSFGYIAGWSSGKEMSELKESLSIIQDCSAEMTKSIDKAIGNKTLEDLAKRKTQKKRKVNMNSEITALLVPVGEKPKEITIQNELDALQATVKGYIEFYPLANDINIICNEEGKINGMEGNRLVGNEIICGDFLIVGDNGMGETISLSPAQVKLCKEQFKTPLEFSREQIEDNLVIRVIDTDDPRSFVDTRPTPMPRRYGSRNKSKKNNRER